MREALLDPRRSVRRMATKCMCKLLGAIYEQPRYQATSPLLYRELEETAIAIFQKAAAMEEGTDLQQTLYMLYFLGVGLQIMPAQIGTNLMSHFFSLIEAGNISVMVPTFLNIETFMAAKKLSAEFVEQVLKYLLENSPAGEENKTNDVLNVSYMQSLVQTFLNLNKYGYSDSTIRVVSKYLPAFVISMGELMVSPSMRVAKSASNSIQSVFNSCLSPEFFVKKAPTALGIEELGISGDSKDAGVSFLAQTVANLQYLLTIRFAKVAPDAYKLIGLFAAKLRTGLIPELPTLVHAITEKTEYGL